MAFFSVLSITKHPANTNSPMLLGQKGSCVAGIQGLVNVSGFVMGRVLRNGLGRKNQAECLSYEKILADHHCFS